MPTDRINAAGQSSGLFAASQSKLMICIGSKLNKEPSTFIPMATWMGKGGQVVVIGQEPTKYDSLTQKTRIFSKPREIILDLMKHLNLEIPQYYDMRNICLNLKDDILKVTECDLELNLIQ